MIYLEVSKAIPGFQPKELLLSNHSKSIFKKILVVNINTDFTPTPMTVATVMYYSGLHPYTLKKYYTPKSKQEKMDQHRFFFWYKKENRDWIRKRLTKAKRPDLLKRLLGSDKKESHQS